MNVNKKNEKSDRFKIERKGLDFPLYKDNIGIKKWSIVILLTLIGVFLTTFIPKDLYVIRGPLLCLIPILAYGCISNFKYKELITKFQKTDIVVIILLFIAYMLYTLVIGGILTKLGLVHADASLGNLTSALYWAVYPIQLVGEELFRILVFLFVLAVTYKYISRKAAIIVGLIVSSIMFGLIHYSAYGSLAQIILIQGLGISFVTLGYIKTKNIVVTYIIHMLIDTISFIQVFILLQVNPGLLQHVPAILMSLI